MSRVPSYSFNSLCLPPCATDFTIFDEKTSPKRCTRFFHYVGPAGPGPKSRASRLASREPSAFVLSPTLHLHRDLSDPAPAPHGHAVYLVDLLFDQHQRLRLVPGQPCTLISVPSGTSSNRRRYVPAINSLGSVGLPSASRCSTATHSPGAPADRCSPSSRRPLLYLGSQFSCLAVSARFQETFLPLRCRVRARLDLRLPLATRSPPTCISGVGPTLQTGRPLFGYLVYHRDGERQHLRSLPVSGRFLHPKWRAVWNPWVRNPIPGHRKPPS